MVGERIDPVKLVEAELGVDEETAEEILESTVALLGSQLCEMAAPIMQMYVGYGAGDMGVADLLILAAAVYAGCDAAG